MSGEVWNLVLYVTKKLGPKVETGIFFYSHGLLNTWISFLKWIYNIEIFSKNITMSEFLARLRDRQQSDWLYLFVPENKARFFWIEY